ncbi:thioredoxin [Veillonella magna]|uniref:thioredoxin n=1 Tax=Veillonella magna TaxID=464322 RepID=UPI0023F1E1FB|nr:thioredoxin [Veillonella magna]MBD8976115.1 thioredoxin [Veillonella magna]
MSDVIKDVTVENFKDTVVNHEGVAVVDFWAPWCGYCVRMMPVYDELAANLGDKVVLAKVNTDEQVDLAKEYQIEVLPTFAIFKNGEIVDRKIGYVPLSELQAAVEKHL